MNFFMKFLIAALVLAVLLPFTVLKGKDGRPLMSFGDLKAPELSLPKIPDGVGAALDESGTASQGKDVVYKWRDDKGEWHFSSTPPPQGVEYTSKGYDPNTNLIQSVPVESPTSVAKNTEPGHKTEVNEPSIGDIGSAYSPKKVEKLFDDAKNVQKLLDERFKQQEALIGR